MSSFADGFAELVASLDSVILGKTSVTRMAAICVFAEGHLLLEDYPGVGKTSLAKSLAASMGTVSRRIQFTPDMLPTDVTGTNIFNEKTRDFEFHEGPVFGHVIIGDEINRASPRTQSALLEVMEERQVTTDTGTLRLPGPFIVLATQNPIDMEGTYALPEAQLDRFLMKLRIGYPDLDAETQMLAQGRGHEAIASLEPVLSLTQVRQMIGDARSRHLSESLRRYVASVVAATREHPDVMLGASPRASLALARAAQVHAAAAGRDFVEPDDVKTLAESVLAHRLVLTADARLRERKPESVVRSVLATVRVPRWPGRG
ncbi:MoxR family ATPase [Frankia sp. AgB1.8]|nr:MoxR family ATPase [Frankia sp. AgB1.8]